MPPKAKAAMRVSMRKAPPPQPPQQLLSASEDSDVGSSSEDADGPGGNQAAPPANNNGDGDQPGVENDQPVTSEEEEEEDGEESEEEEEEESEDSSSSDSSSGEESSEPVKKRRKKVNKNKDKRSKAGSPLKFSKTTGLPLTAAKGKKLALVYEGESQKAASLFEAVVHYMKSNRTTLQPDLEGALRRTLIKGNEKSLKPESQNFELLFSKLVDEKWAFTQDGNFSSQLKTFVYIATGGAIVRLFQIEKIPSELKAQLDKLLKLTSKVVLKNVMTIDKGQAFIKTEFLFSALKASIEEEEELDIGEKNFVYEKWPESKWATFLTILKFAINALALANPKLKKHLKRFKGEEFSSLKDWASEKLVSKDLSKLILLIFRELKDGHKMKAEQIVKEVVMKADMMRGKNPSYTLSGRAEETPKNDKGGNTGNNDGWSSWKSGNSGWKQTYEQGKGNGKGKGKKGADEDRAMSASVILQKCQDLGMSAQFMKQYIKCGYLKRSNGCRNGPDCALSHGSPSFTLYKANSDEAIIAQLNKWCTNNKINPDFRAQPATAASQQQPEQPAEGPAEAE